MQSDRAGDRYGLVADDGDVAGDGRVLWQRRIGLLRQLQGQQGREVQLCGENLAVNAVAAGNERMDLAEAAEVDAAHADAGAAAGMERRIVLLGGIAGLGDIHAAQEGFNLALHLEEVLVLAVGAEHQMLRLVRQDLARASAGRPSPAHRA